MAVLAENLILSGKEALDGTHQRAALAGEVGGSFTLEGGLEEIAGTDADAEGDGVVQGMSGDILVDSV